MTPRLRMVLVAAALILLLMVVLLLFNPGALQPNSANQPALTQPMTETTRRPVPTLAIIDLPPVALGQSSTKDGFTVTIFGVTFQKSLGDITPNTGNVYLVADVQLENTRADAIEYSNLHFGVTDANGRTYQPAHGSFDWAPTPAIKAGQLAKGSSMRGNVVIEIPASLSSGMVSYQNEQANTEIWYRYLFTWK